MDDPLPRSPYPPINFLYSRFHDSIRSELDALSQYVLALDQAAEKGLLDRLLTLKERYHFLEQVYKYHSSVEDEVGPTTWSMHFVISYCSVDGGRSQPAGLA